MTAGCCRCWITTGAVLLGLGIIAGAYGAHGLDEQLMEVHGNKPPVERLGSSITAASKALDDFRTGVRYHVWHALGLIAVGLVGSLPGTRRWPLHLAGFAFGLGIVGFSGVLYVLTVTGNSAVAPLAPVGGTLIIVGWFLLAAGACPCGSSKPSD
ncbi:MAG: DUF423 domain-containing protein [Planctomycetaceae bacterium]